VRDRRRRTRAWPEKLSTDISERSMSDGNMWLTALDFFFFLMA
jgi:hypothetical protein